MRIFALAFFAVCLAGCISLTPESRVPLYADELAMLNSHKDLTFATDGMLKECALKLPADAPKDKYGFYLDSLRSRVLRYSKALKLTKEEIANLSSSAPITICGKCGNLKGTPTCCVPDAKTTWDTGYAVNSIANRMLGY